MEPFAFIEDLNKQYYTHNMSLPYYAPATVSILERDRYISSSRKTHPFHMLATAIHEIQGKINSQIPKIPSPWFQNILSSSVGFAESLRISSKLVDTILDQQSLLDRLRHFIDRRCTDIMYTPKYDEDQFSEIMRQLVFVICSIRRMPKKHTSIGRLTNAVNVFGSHFVTHTNNVTKVAVELLTSKIRIVQDESYYDFVNMIAREEEKDFIDMSSHMHDLAQVNKRQKVEKVGLGNVYQVNFHIPASIDECDDSGDLDGIKYQEETDEEYIPTQGNQGFEFLFANEYL